jgi:hypothetical protein
MRKHTCPCQESNTCRLARRQSIYWPKFLNASSGKFWISGETPTKDRDLDKLAGRAIALVTKAVATSGSSVSFYRTTRLNVPEDSQSSSGIWCALTLRLGISNCGRVLEVGDLKSKQVPAMPQHRFPAEWRVFVMSAQVLLPVVIRNNRQRVIGTWWYVISLISSCFSEEDRGKWNNIIIF